ncbi:MAG TPA: hypothetical protein VK558_02705 [Patescibacteria group bacterium]|nr:hypothetical protein [Patescibacteria group bacterium]
MLRRLAAAVPLALALAAGPLWVPQGMATDANIPTNFTCQQHIADINDWIDLHKEPSTIGGWARQGAEERRDAAVEACNAGNQKDAFKEIANARRMLGMPKDTAAAADVARTVEVIDQQQAAALGNTRNPDAVAPPE